MKTCSCCFKPITESEWPRLPYVGVMSAHESLPALELRNHDCGSTLAIEIPRATAVQFNGEV